MEELFVSNVANCWGRKQHNSEGSCTSNQILHAGGAIVTSAPNSLVRISYLATLDHLEARECHSAVCLESRGQAFLASRPYDIHSFCCCYASAVKAFGALSLSGLNLLAAGCHCCLRRTTDFWERLQEDGAWECLGVQQAEQKALFSCPMSI